MYRRHMNAVWVAVLLGMAVFVLIARSRQISPEEPLIHEIPRVTKSIVSDGSYVLPIRKSQERLDAMISTVRSELLESSMLDEVEETTPRITPFE